MPEKILIDCGHGGSDPGAVGYVREVDITHAWGHELANQINRLGGDVYVLQDGADANSDLNVPVSEANAYGLPWLFVSIHANAGGGTGYENYLYTGAWTDAASSELGWAVMNSYGPVAKKYGLANRGLKAADFYVLRGTNRRACLLELGFVDKYFDAQLLANAAYRAEACEAIARALMRTAGQAIKEPAKPTPTPPPQPVQKADPAPDPKGIVDLSPGRYIFVSAETPGMVLAGRNNEEACIWGIHGGDDQFWDWDGVRLMNVKHQKALTLGAAAVKGKGLLNYDTSNIWPYIGADHQKVYFYEGKNGALFIMFKHSNKALDVLDHKTANGSRVGQYSAHGKPNQMWIPIKLG